MTPEGKVKDKVKKLLAPYVRSKKLWYFMPAASQFGRAGTPDFVGCYQGAMFAVETKAGTGNILWAATGKGKPTDLQWACMNAMDDAGVTVLVINEDNIDELQGWIDACP